MSRLLRFTAQTIDGYEDDFGLTVGFARDPHNETTDDALLLQRAREGDPDDQGIYAEIPVQRRVSYGGIKSATFRPGHFAIAFAPETMRDFGDIAGMEISFQLPAADFDRLAALLRRIFRDEAALEIIRPDLTS